jgi:hypothetical protein
VPETLGLIASHLRDKKLGDPKVYESLTQMAKLHRNPIAHPEVILSVAEAIAIVGMANSVMTPMLDALPDAPLTTASPPALVGPTGT